MKKFIIKGLIFSVILAACIHICNQAFLKSELFYGITNFDDVPDKLDICDIGNSYAMMGFNYEEYENNLKCVNFGLGGQSHVYDYNILQHYRNHLRKGSLVLIVVSFPTFLGKSETEDSMWHSKNLKYYRILSPKYIREFDYKTWLRMNVAPFIYSEGIRDLWEKSKESYENYWNQVSNVEDVYSFNQEAKKRVKWQLIDDKIDEHGNMIYLQEEIDAVYDMISLCKEEGAIPILITPPFTDLYVKNIKKEVPQYYYHGFYNIISKIQKDTGGVEYYDYSIDERFSKNYNEFIGVDHLNKTAAKKFTAIVMEEVVGNRLKIKE